MSESSNQSRQEQYRPFVGNKPRKSNAGVGKGALSDGAGKDPVQPNNRGPQGVGG